MSAEFFRFEYVQVAIGSVEPATSHPVKGEIIVLAVINDTGILVVLVAVILLFGASQIPKLARNLGEASKEFRKAHEDVQSSPPPAERQTNQSTSPCSTSAPRS
jgi:sec-independent protein translocase protein TatA